MLLGGLLHVQISGNNRCILIELNAQSGEISVRDSGQSRDQMAIDDNGVGRPGRADFGHGGFSFGGCKRLDPSV